MPRLTSTAVPAYRRHKASGQAIVSLDGRDFYLGVWKSAPSKVEYNRIIGEWMAAGRRLPTDPNAVTVLELADAYRAHCRDYYCDAAGVVSREVNNIDEVLKPLLRLYGETRAIEFGPLRLKAVREAMIESGHVRTNINRKIARIKSMFKWATECERLDASVFHALQAVSGLKYGRCSAEESEPVRPVAEHVLVATLDVMNPYLKSMVEVQQLTGMRPGELCSMTSAAIDTSGGHVWIFKPAQHKNRFRGHVREIRIGPRAQAILRPFLKTDLQAAVFSPIEAEAQRHEQQRQERATPLTPSQAERAEKSKLWKRRRAPKDHYTVASFRRAIARACKRADVPQWHPHQVRHRFATDIRRDYGPEAALVLLGDKSTRMIDVYAERDGQSATAIVEKVG